MSEENGWKDWREMPEGVVFETRDARPGYRCVRQWRRVICVQEDDQMQHRVPYVAPRSAPTFQHCRPTGERLRIEILPAEPTAAPDEPHPEPTVEAPKLEDAVEGQDALAIAEWFRDHYRAEANAFAKLHELLQASVERALDRCGVKPEDYLGLHHGLEVLGDRYARENA